MPEGMSKLEETINKFERLLAEMREETRRAHEVLKDLHTVERSVKHLLSTEAAKMVDELVEKLVKEELEKIGPELVEYSTRIYDRVGREVDKIIDICLGKEFSSQHNRADLRPALAEKLREWLEEIIDEK